MNFNKLFSFVFCNYGIEVMQKRKNYEYCDHLKALSLKTFIFFPNQQILQTSIIFINQQINFNFSIKLIINIQATTLQCLVFIFPFIVLMIIQQQHLHRRSFNNNLQYQTKLCLNMMNNSSLNSNKSFTKSKQPYNRSQLSTGNDLQTFRTHNANPLKVIELKAIQNYKAINKLKLNQQTMEKINYALQIDQSSHKQFERRIKTNSLFFEYDVNPLLIPTVSPINKKSVKKIIEQAKGIASIKIPKNMLAAVNDMKLQKQNQLDSKRQNIKTQSVSMKIHKNQIDKIKNKLLKKDKQIQTSSFSNKIVSQQVITVNELDQFDKIIHIKEQNFFRKKYDNQSFNIFSVVFGKEQFQSNDEILKKYYFCHDSIVKQSTNVSVFKDISSKARLIISNKAIKKYVKQLKLTELDLNFKINNIEFKDMMQLISGQIDYDILYNFINDQRKIIGKNDEQSQSQIVQQKQIFYKPNVKHVMSVYDQNKNQKADISYYIREPFGRNQNNQKELTEYYKDKLLNILKRQQQSILNNIKHHELHQKYKEQKNECLEVQLLGNANFRDTELNKDVERKIRMSKLYKDRSENIKINQITKTWKMKNVIQGRKKNQNSKPSHSKSFWK